MRVEAVSKRLFHAGTHGGAGFAGADDDDAAGMGQGIANAEMGIGQSLPE